MTDEIVLHSLDVSKYVNYSRIKNMNDIDTILMPWLLGQPIFGLDVETTVTKEFFDRKTRTIQLGTKTQQFIIDLLDFTGGDPGLLADCQGWYGLNLHAAPLLGALLSRLAPFLCSGEYLKVGTNLGFEFTQFYWGFGIAIWHLYDCGLVERLRVAGIHSLDDYSYFSMQSQVARYFKLHIDKTLQTSFTIDQPLSQEQCAYAVLDTRLPLGIRLRQLHGHVQKNGVRTLGIIEEGLSRVAEIENDAIGPFAQMHIHGEKIDTVAWSKRIDGVVAEAQAALNKLDSYFIPIVGSKNEIVTDAAVAEADAKWKAIKDTKDPHRILLKQTASMLGKARTWGKHMVNDVQGEALVNYESPSQLLKLLRANFKGLAGLKSTDDEYLKHHANTPVIAALRDYRELSKQISTYGYAWAKEWTTHPCNEEGWLSPYTHKLHAVFNQLAADTGRSSSEKPNGQNLLRIDEVRHSFIAELGHVYITGDMSGAELRILAELAKAKTWIEAYARKEDIHSWCCEILFPIEWPKNAEPDCEYYTLHTDDTNLARSGLPKHWKCSCKKHAARRQVTKELNFLLVYGGTAATLAARMGITVNEAETLMAAHQAAFPDIHAYLEEAGKNAVRFWKSYDMYGRRRLYRVPDKAAGRAKILKYWKESVALPSDVAGANITAWKEAHKIVTIDLKGKEKTTYINPIADEKFWLTHREPSQREIMKAVWSMTKGVERAGKNLPMQGTNASIAKLAMGAGYDKNMKPYLFHILPKLKARFVKFVHDEFVVTAPQEFAEEVAFEIGDAFRRAAAEVMHSVEMEFEYAIKPYWAK